MPLGYEVVMFEKYDRAGGLDAHQHPRFSAARSRADDEINQILDMGVEIRYNSDVTSMKALLAEGFDAIFVGTGGPRGKELDIPGRHDTDRITLDDCLESIAFGHTDSVGEKVLIIGVGNTAMDLLPVPLPSGRERLKVMARRPRGSSKPRLGAGGSEEEASRSSSITRHALRHRNGKLIGMEFEHLNGRPG